MGRPHMPPRRLQLLVFLLSFITYAWFCQGGGWNQNARFAEVRSIVEWGELSIDDYLVYWPKRGREGSMERACMKNGDFMRDDVVHRLCWGNGEWDAIPVNGRPLTEKVTPVLIGSQTCSGDIGVAPDGHFHPNKPPGTSFLGIPAYFFLYHIEELKGVDQDHWWTLTLNAWLTSVFSVGLVSALGVVFFFRLCGDLFPGRTSASLFATLVFGFGTTFLPFATIFFDHNLTASLLIMAFYAARRKWFVSAGVCAGIGAVTNYLAAIPGGMIALYLLLRMDRKDWRAVLHFSLGVLPCLLVLLAYNKAAFGSFLSLNTNFQNPVFKDVTPAFLGMFGFPSWFSAVVVTVTPWRGLFWLCPVLILSVAALWVWMRQKTMRAERWLIVGIALFFFVVNITFNGFHGGFAAGPRYLIPAIPFLCLPLVEAVTRWRRIALALATVSVVQQGLLTVTDAQNPIGVGSHAWVNRPDEWKDKLWNYSLVGDYAWPLFRHGRAWPIVHRELDEHLDGVRRMLEKEHPEPGEREAWFNLIEKDSRAKVSRGDKEPLWIAAMPGPVSVNVMGMWDGTYFQTYDAHTTQARWVSFNAGEFIWPASRLSLLPLVLLWLAGGGMAWWWLRPRRS